MAINYYRSDGWVKTVQGSAVPGAQIYVCFQPANVTPPITPPRTTPVPWQGPNPQAPVFSDAGLTPIIQPIITDGFGHYDFYALPGLYTVVIMYSGKVQEVLIDQSVGNVGSSGGNLISLETNGSPNFNQNRLNLQQGPGIILFSENDGTTTISGGSGGAALETNGVPNTDQGLLNLKNGTDIGITSDGVGGVTVASTARPGLPQPDAARFILWESLINASAINTIWQLTSDTIFVSTGGGGGSNGVAYSAPTGTAGAAVEVFCNGTVGASYSSSPVFWPTRNVVFKSTMKARFDIIPVGGNFYLGVSSVVASVAHDPTTGDCAVVSFNKPENLAFSNLLFICSVGGATTTIDTGIPASDPTGTLGIRYDIKIVISGGVATLFVNGAMAATSATHVPTSNPLGATWFLLAADVVPDGTLFVKSEYVYCENSTPV